MQQLTIFDVIDFDYKKSRIDELLNRVKKIDPEIDVSAVFIYPERCGGAEPSFALKENGQFKLFSFWHGKLNLQHYRIRDRLPNDDWIIL